MSGTTTNDQKHRVWQKIYEIFKSETNVDLGTEKCRKLFQRLKAEEKKKHDETINKQYMKECSKTGGGVGPSPPPQIDGDDINTEIDFCDPTETSWNSSVTFEEHKKEPPSCFMKLTKPTVFQV